MRASEATGTRFVAGSATGSEPRAWPLAAPGDRIGRFEIARVLGQGGMGVVYAAHDPRLRREVALKVLRAGPADRGHHARVMREARALARLSHPHVVPIFDVGLDRGTLWVAMELVRGPTLSAWLATRPAWPKIVDAFVQAGRGLAAAHAAGLVHRDFKPGNAMLAPDGRVVVLDFGLAWAPGVEGGRADATASSSTSGDGSSARRASSARDPLAYTLTDAGTVVGTLPYMAPEQHACSDVDARADQYALCVSLYEGLAGKRPFGGQPADMIAAKRSGPPAPPKTSPAPARLWRVIARGLHPDPQRRFADVQALVRALERTVQSRPRPAVWILGVAAIGLSAVTWAIPADVPCAAEARIDAMWNAPRRVALSDAFVARGAQATWSTVEPLLEERFAEYRELARTTCDAVPRHAAAIEAPDDCLDRGVSAAGVALDLLAAPDRGTISAAPRLVRALPRVRDCELRAPESAARDPVLQGQLERARALQQVGRMQEAAALAEQGIARARTRDDAAGTAAARLLLGGCQMELGTWDDAQASLETAHHEAVAAGDDRVATTSAIKLAHLAAYRVQPDAGDTWLREAEASLLRMGDSGGMERAQLELARGDLQATGGRFDDARASYEAALEGAIAHGGEDQLVVSVILTAIGTAHARAGRPRDALGVYERALVIEERLVGARDAGRTSIREMMAAAYYELGRTDEALAAFRSALAAHEEAEGPEHPGVVRLRGNLVLLLLDAGRLHEAATVSEEVLALKRRVFGPDDMQVGIALNNQGLVLTQLGRLPEALAAYREALRLYELALGHDHPDLAYPLGGIADTSLHLHRPADALAAVERAVGLRETHGPPADPDLWFLLARARWDSGDRPSAIEAAREAERGLAEAASSRPSKLDPGELQAWLRERGIGPA
jgi:tetratricopeptide (TPR) repeat protein